MKYIICLLIACIFTNCALEKKDLLYDIITEQPSTRGNAEIIIPICSRQDSALICMGSDDFEYIVNRSDLISWEIFSNQLYDAIIKKKYIYVYNDTFEDCKASIIKEIPHIKSIYETEGIDGIIKKFTSDNVFNKDLTFPEIDYIIYLLFQHGLYCRLDHYDAVYYIMNR